MIEGKLGYNVSDFFTVLDEDSNPITGLLDSDFDKLIYDPEGNLSSVESNVYELSHGNYKLTFKPDQIGSWLIVIKNDDYFPWGKSNNMIVYENNIDDIFNNTIKILGLNQENYFLDDMLYDENHNMIYGRIRIYSDSESVGTNNNVISMYEIDAEWDGALLQSYKVYKS